MKTKTKVALVSIAGTTYAGSLLFGLPQFLTEKNATDSAATEEPAEPEATTELAGVFEEPEEILFDRGIFERTLHALEKGNDSNALFNMSEFFKNESRVIVGGQNANYSIGNLTAICEKGAERFEGTEFDELAELLTATAGMLGTEPDGYRINSAAKSIHTVIGYLRNKENLGSFVEEYKALPAPVPVYEFEGEFVNP